MKYANLIRGQFLHEWIYVENYINLFITYHDCIDRRKLGLELKEVTEIPLRTKIKILTRYLTRELVYLNYKCKSGYTLVEMITDINGYLKMRNAFAHDIIPPPKDLNELTIDTIPHIDLVIIDKAKQYNKHKVDLRYLTKDHNDNLVGMSLIALHLQDLIDIT
jgi:hypothetical protein